MDAENYPECGVEYTREEVLAFGPLELDGKDCGGYPYLVIRSEQYGGPVLVSFHTVHGGKLIYENVIGNDNNPGALGKLLANSKSYTGRLF